MTTFFLQYILIWFTSPSTPCPPRTCVLQTLPRVEIRGKSSITVSAQCLRCQGGSLMRRKSMWYAQRVCRWQGLFCLHIHYIK
jgi:hypothetical protein